MFGDTFGVLKLEWDVNTNELDRDLKKTEKSVEKTTRNIGTDIQNATRKLIAYASGALIIREINNLANGVQNATRTIRRETGFSVDALDGLLNVSRQISREVPNSLEEISSVVGSIARNFEATESQIISLSTTFLNFANVTGASIQVIDQFGIIAERNNLTAQETENLLNRVEAVTSRYNVSVDELATRLSQTRNVLAQYGFTLNEQVEIIGRLNAAGVEMDDTLDATFALFEKARKPGEEFTKTISRFAQEIRKLPTNERLAKLVELTGETDSRVLERIFELIQDFDNIDLTNVSTNVNDLAEQFRTISDRLSIIRNQLSEELTPSIENLVTLTERFLNSQAFQNIIGQIQFLSRQLNDLSTGLLAAQNSSNTFTSTAASGFKNLLDLLSQLLLPVALLKFGFGVDVVKQIKAVGDVLLSPVTAYKKLNVEILKNKTAIEGFNKDILKQNELLKTAAGVMDIYRKDLNKAEEALDEFIQGFAANVDLQDVYNTAEYRNFTENIRMQEEGIKNTQKEMNKLNDEILVFNGNIKKSNKEISLLKRSMALLRSPITAVAVGLAAIAGAGLGLFLTINKETQDSTKSMRVMGFVMKLVTDELKDWGFWIKNIALPAAFNAILSAAQFTFNGIVKGLKIARDGFIDLAGDIDKLLIKIPFIGSFLQSAARKGVAAAKEVGESWTATGRNLVRAFDAYEKELQRAKKLEADRLNIDNYKNLASELSTIRSDLNKELSEDKINNNIFDNAGGGGVDKAAQELERLREAAISLKEGVDPVFQLNNEMVELLKTVAQFPDIISPDIFKDIVQDLIDGFDDEQFAKIRENMENFAPEVQNAINSRIFDENMDGLFTSVEEDIDNLREKFTEAKSSVQGWLDAARPSEAFLEAWKLAKEQMLTFFGETEDGKSLIPMDVMTAAAEDLMSNFNDVTLAKLYELRDMIESDENLKNIFGPLIDTEIAEKLKEEMDEILTGVSDIGKSISDIGGNIGSELLTRIGAITNAAGELYKRFIAVRDAIQTIKKAKEAFETVKTAVKALAGSILDIILLLVQAAEAMGIFGGESEKELTGIDKFLDEIGKKLEEWGEELTDTLVEFVKTGVLEIRALLNSILEDILRVSIQVAITDPITQGLQSISGFSKGGIISSTGIVGKTASGSIAVAGEAGPEGILPLKRINGRLGVEFTGSNSSPVNVVVNNNAPVSVTTSEEVYNNQKYIKIMIEDTVNNMMNSGSGDKSFGNNYGINRKPRFI